MKIHTNKWFYPLTLALFLVLSLGISVKVRAENGDSSDGIKINTEIETSDDRSSGSLSASTTVRNEDRNTGEEEKDATETKATSSDREDDRGDNNSQGEDHRSKVAGVVQNLLSIAERDGGIGDDVKIVAQEQASTSVRVKDDMDEVNSESSLKVFLFGSNFKNLGDLRSTIETTQNHIQRLKKAEEKATSTTIKADLSAQINALQQISSTTEVFVQEHENKFSLFGWLVKLFNK